MENKATDKEIKKALERCTSVAYRGVCKDCVYMKFKMTDEGCLTPMLKDVFSLINRQEVEIEGLRSNLDVVNHTISYFKSEAVKEFAELSIKRICEQVSAPTPSESYIVEKCIETLDNLVKEKVGEE